MIAKRAMLKARPILDPMFEEDDRQFKFFVLEGPCRKCGVGDHSLVYFEFTENRKNRSQGIFRTMCIACGDRNMNYSKDVTTATDEPARDPTISIPKRARRRKA